MDGDQLRPRRSKRKICLETSSKMDDENSTQSTVDDAEFIHDGEECVTDGKELCVIDESCTSNAEKNAQNKVSASEIDPHPDVSEATHAITDFSKGETFNKNSLPRDMSAESAAVVKLESAMAEGREMLSKAMNDMKEMNQQVIKEMSETMGQVVNVWSEKIQPFIQQPNSNISTHENAQVTRADKGSKIKRPKQSSHHTALVSDSSSESNSELSSDDECDTMTSRNMQLRARRSSTCKIPPFTGKEKWEVWFNRFEDIAKRRCWTEDEKLDELLPRLQGVAGEFVFSQLSSKSRQKYNKLVKELGSRFKVVEVAKTYQVQFSKRVQKSGESIENFAAELKRLYTKAYPKRPASIRQEDLLRKFLDGLCDNHVRQQVEFVKQPASIDDAVVEVINFIEGSKKVKFGGDNGYQRKTYMVRPALDSDESDDDDDSDDDRVARLPEKSRKPKQTGTFTNQTISNSQNTGSQHRSNFQSVKESTDVKQSVNALLQKQKEILTAIQGNQQDFKGMQCRLDRLEKANTSIHKGFTRQPRADGQPRPITTRGNGPQVANTNRRGLTRRPVVDGQCFNCGTMGHFARNCPQAPWLTGHVQMSVQPGPMPEYANANNGTDQGRQWQNSDGNNRCPNRMQTQHLQSRSSNDSVTQATLNTMGSTQ